MYYFDMQRFLKGQPGEKERYDTLKFVSSLQGLVNRETPRLYINFIDGVDRYWLNKLSEGSGFLKKEDIVEIASFEGLLVIFREEIRGMVLWDEKVPATSNVAATICGVEGYLPVRYDERPESFYKRYAEGGPSFEVKVSLVNKFKGQGIIPDTSTTSTGSAKCDAYLWAKEKYLDTGRCNDSLMAYMLDAFSWKEGTFSYPDMDNTLLANHDYFIANKAFFFDLSPWDDETPNDDKEQPLGTDYRTLKELLMSQYIQNGGKKITSVGGFTPWHVKYVGETNPHCRHGGVETEWHYAAILSAHNAMMDADAPMLCGMANASVFCRFPLKEKYIQNPRPAAEASHADKTYIMYYMGDYDSAAWLSRNTPRVWDDPKRGNLPLAWAFNPNLSARAPHVFDYVYSTKTKNDYFVAGDSGAGYINPLYLLEPRRYSELPDAMDLWVEHNKYFYKKFDLSITGFIINGHEPINEIVQKAYSVFSKDGAAIQNEGEVKAVVGGTVFHPHSADIAVLDGDMDAAASIIYSKTEPGASRFHIFRSILCTPGFMEELTKKIKGEHPERNYQVVDPYTFFRYLKADIEFSDL